MDKAREGTSVVDKIKTNDEGTAVIALCIVKLSRAILKNEIQQNIVWFLGNTFSLYNELQTMIRASHDDNSNDDNFKDYFVLIT